MIITNEKRRLHFEAIFRQIAFFCVANAHYDFTEKCFLFECVYRFTVDVELKNVFISSALFISQKVSQLTKNHILGIFA